MGGWLIPTQNIPKYSPPPPPVPVHHQGLENRSHYAHGSSVHVATRPSGWDNHPRIFLGYTLTICRNPFRLLGRERYYEITLTKFLGLSCVTVLCSWAGWNTCHSIWSQTPLLFGHGTSYPLPIAPEYKVTKGNLVWINGLQRKTYWLIYLPILGG